MSSSSVGENLEFHYMRMTAVCRFQELEVGRASSAALTRRPRCASSFEVFSKTFSCAPQG